MWYFWELTKLHGYRVVFYVFQVLLRIARKSRLDCTLTFETMSRILGFFINCFMGLCFMGTVLCVMVLQYDSLDRMCLGWVTQCPNVVYFVLLGILVTFN